MECSKNIVFLASREEDRRYCTTIVVLLIKREKPDKDVILEDVRPPYVRQKWGGRHTRDDSVVHTYVFRHRRQHVCCSTKSPMLVLCVLPKRSGSSAVELAVRYRTAGTGAAGAWAQGSYDNKL